MTLNEMMKTLRCHAEGNCEECPAKSNIPEKVAINEAYGVVRNCVESVFSEAAKMLAELSIKTIEQKNALVKKEREYDQLLTINEILKENLNVLQFSYDTLYARLCEREEDCDA